GRIRVGGVLEVVGQVGVECDAIAVPELVALPVADQHQRAVLDQRRLTAAGLMHRRIVGGARGAAWCERVARELSALTWLGGGEDLEAVPAASVSAVLALARTNDRDRPALVEPQKLGEAQREPGGYAPGSRQGGARPAALDLREHRRADAAALGEVAQRQARGLAQRLHPRADHGR